MASFGNSQRHSPQVQRQQRTNREEVIGERSYLLYTPHIYSASRHGMKEITWTDGILASRHKMQFSARKKALLYLKDIVQEGQRSIYSFRHSCERIVYNFVIILSNAYS